MFDGRQSNYALKDGSYHNEQTKSWLHDPFGGGSWRCHLVAGVCQLRANIPDSRSGDEREPGRHAMAELHRLSRLAPEILRASRLRPGMGPGDTTGTAGIGAGGTFQGCREEGARPGRLRRFAMGSENSRASNHIQRPGSGTFRRSTQRMHYALRVRLAYWTHQSSAFQIRTGCGTEEIRPGPVPTRSNPEHFGPPVRLGRR